MKILCLDILYIFLLKRYRASKNWWTLTLRYVIGNLSKRSCNDPQVGNSAILNQTLVDRTRGSVCKIQVEKIENNPPTLWSPTPLRELLFMKRIVVNCIYIYMDLGGDWYEERVVATARRKEHERRQRIKGLWDGSVETGRKIKRGGEKRRWEEGNRGESSARNGIT